METELVIYRDRNDGDGTCSHTFPDTGHEECGDVIGSSYDGTAYDARETLSLVRRLTLENLIRTSEEAGLYDLPLEATR